MTKVIVNEYAVQLFFSKMDDGECRFIQWDIMPCLTWRGFGILEVSALIEGSSLQNGVSVAPPHLVTIYKEVRSALCNPATKPGLDDDALRAAAADGEIPDWMGRVSDLRGSKLRKLFYLRKGLAEIRGHLRFYVLNMLRFLNPPGLVIATSPGLCDAWRRCFELATAAEEAFPFTGIIVLGDGRPSLRARLGLVRELYLGRVIVTHSIGEPPRRGHFFGSRSFNFLVFGGVDGVVEEGTEKVPRNELVLQGLIHLTKRIFIKK